MKKNELDDYLEFIHANNNYRIDRYINDFCEESNIIEGIQETTQEQVDATAEFIKEGDRIDISQLENLLSVLQPDAVLRNREGLNVRVGNHVPPSGGPIIELRLIELLKGSEEEDPYDFHHRYENLHPFTDGNGRTGRAIWVRMMYKQYKLQDNISFLHHWYYQSLQNHRS